MPTEGQNWLKRTVKAILKHSSPNLIMHFLEIAQYFEKIEKVPSRLEMTAILAQMLSKVAQDDIKNVIYLSQGMLGTKHQSIESGMGEGLIEQGIAKATGYPKEDVLKLYKEIGDLGEVAEKLAKGKKQSALFSGELTI